MGGRWDYKGHGDGRTEPAVSTPHGAKQSKRNGLFWSRYIKEGHNSFEEFDLHRFFEDVEYVAIKVALLASLIIILWLPVEDHLPKPDHPNAEHVRDTGSGPRRVAEGRL